jgi:hypothetical protein
MVGLLKQTSQEAEIQSAGSQASDVARFNPSTPPRLKHLTQKGGPDL